LFKFIAGNVPDKHEGTAYQVHSTVKQVCRAFVLPVLRAEGVFTDLASFVFLFLLKFISYCIPVTNMLYLAHGMEN
jgi:hypothetical protein